ncbi:Glycogen syn domain containing protein, partial [Trichuris trichiura]
VVFSASIKSDVATAFVRTIKLTNEVAHISVGGIYTVLRTKAAISTEELGEQYCMIGPYNESMVKLEVEMLEPETSSMRSTLESMRAQGVKVIFGRWLIDGYPKVVLFDIGTSAWRLDNWKKELWDSCHVGIPWQDHESNDAVIFGFLVAWFLQEVIFCFSPPVFPPSSLGAV